MEKLANGALVTPIPGPVYTHTWAGTYISIHEISCHLSKHQRAEAKYLKSGKNLYKSSLARLQEFWNSSICLYEIKKKNLSKSTCPTGSFTALGCWAVGNGEPCYRFLGLPIDNQPHWKQEHAKFTDSDNHKKIEGQWYQHQVNYYLQRLL